MKTKGQRQSKNVEHGKRATDAEIAAHEMFDWNGEVDSPRNHYTGIAKQQLKDQNAFARGRRMGVGDQHKAIASGKLGKNSATEMKGPRFPKRDQNPFAKARSK
jgi:hypothetical protein